MFRVLQDTQDGDGAGGLTAGDVGETLQGR